MAAEVWPKSYLDSLAEGRLARLLKESREKCAAESLMGQDIHDSLAEQIESYFTDTNTYNTYVSSHTIVGILPPGFCPLGFCPYPIPTLGREIGCGRVAVLAENQR